MNLKTYIASMNMTLREFCEILDCCSYVYLSQIATGTSKGSKKIRKEIEDLTGGQVKLPEFPDKKDFPEDDLAA